MSNLSSRLALIDALKGIASQLIVLHHLAFYGPMSDVALILAPDLIAWLYDYGRIAVQAFLVMAGFLAARGLAPAGVLLGGQPLQQIGRRYLSLTLPLLMALLFAILAAAVARSLITHDSIPAAPGLMQFLANALLLHSLLGADALSAGVWYVAIDFQLFVLLMTLLYLARWCGQRWGRAERFAWFLVGGLLVASLLVFNRDAGLDNWGVYFFGSYGLGVFAYWASQQQRAGVWLAAILLLGGLALLLDWRLRIAVALTLALLLAVANRSALMAWPSSRFLGWLGQISYSVFLIHFPVCLVVNALIQQIDAGSPAFNLFGMGVAWVLSVAAGALFHRYVESRVRVLPVVRGTR